MARDSSFSQKFRTLFQDEKSKLIAARTPLSGTFAAVPEESMDEVDLVSRDLDAQMNLRMLKRETLYLKKIDEALERLSAGTFGSCETCEEDIELRRLEARPTTTHCLSCKEMSEHTPNAGTRVGCATRARFTRSFIRRCASLNVFQFRSRNGSNELEKDWSADQG